MKTAKKVRRLKSLSELKSARVFGAGKSISAILDCHASNAFKLAACIASLKTSRSQQQFYFRFE